MTLTRVPTGTWLPAYVPKSKGLMTFLFLVCSASNACVSGYDGSMMNGLNILPSYTEYFKLNPATTGLQTASLFLGAALSSLFSGVLCDKLGRRPTLFWASIISLLGVVLQGAAQNVAMFTIARIVVGFGAAMSGIAGAVYLSETLSIEWRAFGVGLLNNFYYVGALVAAGMTLGTSKWASTWAWRAPSIVQGIFSLACVLILPFIPESPRWRLAGQGMSHEAHLVVAQTNARGDMDAPLVLNEIKEILDTIEYEKNAGQTMSPLQLFKTATNRRRLFLAATPAVFANIVGNNIATYYLGAELATAGITEPIAQLQANIVLNVVCLFAALGGTWLCAHWGRKPVAILSQTSLTILLFIVGGLTKLYADITEDGGTASTSLSYGTVAVMFLFQIAYSIGWTPLFTLYGPEVMNYSMRANGQAFCMLLSWTFGMAFVFIMPIGIANIGWKMYIANACWDVSFIVIIVVFWVETKGLTLEEVDALFGEKHSDAPNMQDVAAGRVDASTLQRTRDGVWQETAQSSEVDDQDAEKAQDRDLHVEGLKQ